MKLIAMLTQTNNCLLITKDYSQSDKNGKPEKEITKKNNYWNLSFQKTTFYNGECHCSRQQPK